MSCAATCWFICLYNSNTPRQTHRTHHIGTHTNSLVSVGPASQGSQVQVSLIPQVMTPKMITASNTSAAQNNFAFCMDSSPAQKSSSHAIQGSLIPQVMTPQQQPTQQQKSPFPKRVMPLRHANKLKMRRPEQLPSNTSSYYSNDSDEILAETRMKKKSEVKKSQSNNKNSYEEACADDKCLKDNASEIPAVTSNHIEHRRMRLCTIFLAPSGIICYMST
jgi:hypothetical protein